MNLVRASYELCDDNLTLEQAIERAGRCCYKSEDKITADSAASFCKMLVWRGHESVLEHANLVFLACDYEYENMHKWGEGSSNHADGGPYPTHRPMLRFTKNGERNLISGNARAWRDALRMRHDVALMMTLGRHWPALFGDLTGESLCAAAGLTPVPNKDLSLCDYLSRDEVLTHRTAMVKFVIDRGVSHELVRHRHDVGFSQESTRYCDYVGGDVTFVIPPWVDLPEGNIRGHRSAKNLEAQRWLMAMQSSEDDYKRLRELGWKPEQARSVLPNSLKTEVVVTATLREWRHIFRMRCSEHAHPQMREVMLPLRRSFIDTGLLPSDATTEN